MDRPMTQIVFQVQCRLSQKLRNVLLLGFRLVIREAFI
jgi:hypothetical protein